MKENDFHRDIIIDKGISEDEKDTSKDDENKSSFFSFGKKKDKKEEEVISEEVEEKKMSLESIINYISDIIVRRADMGKNFGIAVIPEGLIEFIPEMKSMITNLNDIMATLEKEPSFANAASVKDKFNIVEAKLDSENAKVYNSLPALIKALFMAFS